MDHPEALTRRYTVEALLGQGGMGEVYRGLHRSTGEAVAIKALHRQLAPDPTQVERFLREGEALRRLNHPNIVKCRESFEAGGRYYLVLDYVGGGSLRQYLPLSAARAVDIMLDVADALVRSHRLQIVHRDVKPDNILLGSDGSAHLTDFGVAHLGSSWSALTVQGSALGTVEYMSPETCRAEPATPAQDLWSFAVTLYELVSGRTPFRGEGPGQTVMQILYSDVPVLEGELELDALIRRMLHKEPCERLGSMREVALELEKLSPGSRTPVALNATSVQAPVDLLPGHTVELAAGEVLWREGDPSDFVAFLEEGELEVIGSSGEGTIVFTLLKAGEVLGEMSCLDGAPHSATVRARGQVRYRHLGRAEFLAWIRGDPERMQGILLKQSERLRRVAGRLAHSQGPVRRRVAQRLLEGGAAPSTRQLADELGVSSSSLGRGLRELAALGLIRVRRGGYEVLDLEGLRQV